LKHKVLDKWIQAGGHADETDNSMVEGAMREGVEETGITDLKYIPIDAENLDVPIDLEIHAIPENKAKNEPAHWHYGFGYVFTTITNDVNIDQNESTDSKWIAWEEFESMEQFAVVAKKIKTHFK
jgi:8-oxo-dGTP pyrophosphatase MutT (NUDIX family)